MSLPPIWRLIEVLRDASKADRAQWGSFARAVDALPEVGVRDAGEVAFMIAKSARRVLTQLPHAEASADGAARMAMLSLSDWLNREATANGCPYPQPNWAKD